MKEGAPRNIRRIFEDGVLIDRALRRGVREAMRLHKRAGCPIVVWRHGRVVWIKPDRIKLTGNSITA